MSVLVLISTWSCSGATLSEAVCSEPDELGYAACQLVDDPSAVFVNRVEAETCRGEATPHCLEDDDCPAAEACVCDATVSSPGGVNKSTNSTDACLPADCNSSMDCESGVCGVAFDPCGVDGHAATGLYCRSDSDPCRTAADCPDGMTCAAPHGTWDCVSTTTCE